MHTMNKYWVQVWLSIVLVADLWPLASVYQPVQSSSRALIGCRGNVSAGHHCIVVFIGVDGSYLCLPKLFVSLWFADAGVSMPTNVLLVTWRGFLKVLLKQETPRTADVPSVLFSVESVAVDLTLYIFRLVWPASLISSSFFSF